MEQSIYIPKATKEDQDKMNAQIIEEMDNLKEVLKTHKKGVVLMIFVVDSVTHVMDPRGHYIAVELSGSINTKVTDPIVAHSVLNRIQKKIEECQDQIMGDLLKRK